MTEQEMSVLHKKIDAGVKAAIAKAIERHKRLGESISILQDGQVVTLTADEIPTSFSRFPQEDSNNNKSRDTL